MYVRTTFFNFSLLSRFHSYLNTAVAILTAYKGTEPLAMHLKKSFAQRKQMGSRDRKTVSNLCYAAFRLGKAMSQFSVEEAILVGLFLSTEVSDPVLADLKPEWDLQAGAGIEAKLALLHLEGIKTTLLDEAWILSAGIDRAQLALSHFLQPRVFIRVRPGKEQLVHDIIDRNGLAAIAINKSVWSFPQGLSLEAYFDLDKDVVIQDLSSQKVADFFPEKLAPGSMVWDACAACGGKSILLLDTFPRLKLQATDIRETIIMNLRKRFEAAGIQHFKSFVSDLTKPLMPNNTAAFELVVADVPCSGSGTWRRTPEQLRYFKTERIEEFSALQKNIVATISKAVKPGGYLLYITCSVFREENEAIIEWLTTRSNLTIKKMGVINGLSDRSDTMFAALLTA